MTAPYQRALATKENGVPVAARTSTTSSTATTPTRRPATSTGEVVYVNYGLPEDYAELDELGVDVAGKIVLVRYGERFRGVKVQQAEQHGAKGVIIYSDPEDDGFVRRARSIRTGRGARPTRSSAAASSTSGTTRAIR